PQEDMAEMASAVVAEDLGAVAVGVGHSLHRAWDLVVEAGAAAVAGELALGAIERRVATPTDVGAWVHRVRILADEGGLRSLSEDHPGLTGRERVVPGIRRIRTFGFG